MIVTAAHCFYNDEGRANKKRFVFIPGSEITFPYGEQYEIVPDSAVPLTSKIGDERERDVAFVRPRKTVDPLRVPMVASIGTFENFEPSSGDFIVYLTGYLAPWYGLWKDRYPTSETCKIVQWFVDTKEITYNCASTGGMSGSPVYVFAQDRIVIIGINNGSARGAGEELIPFTITSANRGVEGSKIKPALARYQAGKLHPDDR